MPSDAVSALLGIDSARFFADVWGRRVVHATSRQVPKPFTDLGWEWLDNLLSKRNLTYPRLRLANGGELIPPGRFARYREVFAGDPLSVESQIDPGLVHEHVAAGATVVLDRLEGLHAPTGRFGLRLQRQLIAPVQTNLYASKGSVPAFDLHADAGDAFILQLSGRKHWTVYRPGPRPGPDDPPLWDRALQPSDVLYVPAGYWHSVTPSETEAMHLNVSVTPLTMRILLGWAQDQYPDVTAALGRRVMVSAAWGEDVKDILIALAAALSNGVIDDYVTLMRSLDRA